jgi:ribosomal protein S18 acetylase RimI-like enzyme
MSSDTDLNEGARRGESKLAGVVIRSYESRDHDRMWALHREGVMETTPQYPLVDASYEDDLRHVEEEYFSWGSNFWVAEADGRQIVGMVGIRQLDMETGRLRRMRVTATWRRRGLAAALLATAEEFCREHGYRWIVLDTTEQQTAAHSLYENAGFTRTGERSMGPFVVYDYVKELK